MIHSRLGAFGEGLTIGITQGDPLRHLQHTFLSREEAKAFVLHLMTLFAETTWVSERSHTQALIYGPREAAS